MLRKEGVMKFVVMATGYKGIRFLQGLHLDPAFVVSYDNGEGKGLYYRQIQNFCAERGIKMYNKRNLQGLSEEVQKISKIFLVGWQYLLQRHHSKIVVFHDSYVPERRGFSPTICTLLNKEKYLGATALRPYKDTQQPDFGDVYCRMKESIEYPITLKKSFEIVANMYTKMCHDILQGSLQPFKVDYSNSSFSFWRDAEDMRLDWGQTAEEILNKIFILSEPYGGALAIYEGQEIHINEAEIEEDMNFSSRAEHCGKIWNIKNGEPLVVCGQGLIRIKKATDEAGNTIQFKKIRRKFK